MGRIWQTDEMKKGAEISEDLSRRIDQLAARSKLTRGRSLAWQEKWVAGAEAGLADAEKGDFVTEEEIAAVLSKYGPI